MTEWTCEVVKEKPFHQPTVEHFDNVDDGLQEMFMHESKHEDFSATVRLVVTIDGVKITLSSDKKKLTGDDSLQEWVSERIESLK